MRSLVHKLWIEFKENGTVPQGLKEADLVNAAFEIFEIDVEEYSLRMKKLRTEGSSA